MGNRIFKWLTVLFLICNFSCRSGEQEPRKTADKDTGPAFRDASEGLPSNGLWRNSLTFFDIDRDGNMDIIAPPPRKLTKKWSTPMVWYGDGKGKWYESALGVPSDQAYGYGSIAVSDFNGDGIEDVALATHSNRLQAFKGKGSGIYETFSKGFPSQFLSRAIVSGDFNNDGISDLAAFSEASFSNKTYLPTGARVCFLQKDGWKCNIVGNEEAVENLFGDKLAVGDVNNDGNKDLALASLVEYKSLVVWLGDGKGGFKPFNKGLPTDMLYYCVALGDLNHDGRDDFVAGIAGKGRNAFVGPKAFLSHEDGFVDISDGLPEREGLQAVRICDVDKDGHTEIVGGTDIGGIQFFSRKSGRWEKVDVKGLPKEGLRRIQNVYCVDLNADGWLDIAVNYASEKIENGGIRVFFNQGKREDLKQQR